MPAPITPLPALRGTMSDATPEQWETVVANLGLVRRHAGRLPPGDEYDEAMQDGVFGLLRAAQLFDESKGYAFSTYADAWIQNAIERGRGRRHGSNYRRHRYTLKVPYPEPMSLDVELGEDFTLGDTLVSATDVELEAVDGADWERLVERLRVFCTRPIDHELVDQLAVGEKSNARIARRLGVSGEAVRIRRRRLLALARKLVES